MSTMITNGNDGEGSFPGPDLSHFQNMPSFDGLLEGEMVVADRLIGAHDGLGGFALDGEEVTTVEKGGAFGEIGFGEPMIFKIAGAIIGALHGYGRTQQVVPTVAWAGLGYLFPTVTSIVALVMGFREPAQAGQFMGLGSKSTFIHPIPNIAHRAASAGSDAFISSLTLASNTGETQIPGAVLYDAHVASYDALRRVAMRAMTK